MSFPSYSEYKDSGVEWLGDVPKHWQTIRLKRLADLVTDKASTPTRQVGLENIEGWTGRFIDTESEFAGDGIQFNAGDILFGKLRPYLAKVYLSDLPGEAVGDFFVIRPRKINRRFLQKYILSPAVINDLDASTIGAKMPRVSWEDMGLLTIATPTTEEQTTIAAFLDHETTKIDALIQEQQRLIELLKEKRQAVISHAVTKGLDPTVPMKDSGVDWLGEVPAHWDIPKLIYATSRIGDGLHSTPSYEDGTGYFFVNGNNLSHGRIQLGASSKEVPESEYHKHCVLVDERTVLMSINGTVGNLALYNGEPVILGKSACYINCNPCLHREYLMMFLSSSEASHYFDLEVTGTTIFNLSLNSVRQMRICVPSIYEQHGIIQYCTGQDDALRGLIDEASKTIDLMKERRSALISAAVTGKIDVRNWKPPVDESAFDEGVRQAGLEAVS